MTGTTTTTTVTGTTTTTTVHMTGITFHHAMKVLQKQLMEWIPLKPSQLIMRSQESTRSLKKYTTMSQVKMKSSMPCAALVVTE